MDEKDIKIIEFLIDNSRISRTKIGKSLRITETAVRKRIKKLEKDNIILKYTTIINFKNIELIGSFTGIDVNPEDLLNILANLQEISEIKNIYLTTGDHTIMVYIFAKNLEELKRIHETISRIKGVKRVCPSIIIETIK